MLRKAIVVDVHHEDNSVDLVLCDDGSRLSGVPVLASQGGSARTGHVELPEVPNKNTENKWDITQRNGQDMEALVGFMGRGNPVVVGFLYPQVSQMTFKDKRRFNRHRSDVYHTITENGDMELYHPSGAYVRIAEDLEHEDLTKKNHDENLELDRNKDRTINMRVKLGGVTIDIKDGVVTIDAQRVVVPNGDVIASNISLTKHRHTGVKPGNGVSGGPIGGSGSGVAGGGDSGGGSGGGGTGGGSGGEFIPQRDQFGNLVMSDGNGNFFIENQRMVTAETPNGPVTTLVGGGERIYTDAGGNVLSQVTISGANSLYIDQNGQLQQSPDTILVQTVPTGDPLPDNENKA